MTTVEPTLAMLDPASLLVDLNIREAKLDKDFVASIKDHGVIEPIVAVRTENGQVRVRHGHRRTLAAIEAGQALVPVFLAGTEDNDEADRIARQWHENQHRAALTNAEQVAAVDQLALLGLSAATIAKRLRSPRKHVESALNVRASELARAATARYNFLTLEQSAVIADFDEDPEAVKALVAAAKQGDVQFQRAAQTACQDRDRAQGRAALLDALTAAGVTVLDGRPDYRLRLDSLADAEGTVLDAETHVACPGHAAYLSEDWIETGVSEPITPESPDPETEDSDEDGDEDDARWQLAWVAVYACTDPGHYGHRSRYGSPRPSSASAGAAETDPAAQEAAKEAARQERRTTLANNKAWRAALLTAPSQALTGGLDGGGCSGSRSTGAARRSVPVAEARFGSRGQIWLVAVRGSRRSGRRGGAVLRVLAGSDVDRHEPVDGAVVCERLTPVVATP
jgi:ParB family chromosome partitioning protein